MQNDIDLSTEALLKHRAIAEKATPGPWEVLAPDAIYISAPERNEILFENPQEIGTTLSPEEQRATAAHIAANSPDVVMAHVDEIIRLRDEVKRLKEDNEAYRVVMSNFQRITTNLANEIDENDKDAEAEVANLEAQIDWLAARCSEFCDAHNWCAECVMFAGPFVRRECDCGAEIRNRFHKNVIFNMRELARKAVEKQCQK